MVGPGQKAGALGRHQASLGPGWSGGPAALVSWQEQGAGCLSHLLGSESQDGDFREKTGFQGPGLELQCS